MIDQKVLTEMRQLQAPNCPCGQKAFKALQLLLNEVTMNQLAFAQIENVLKSHDKVAVMPFSSAFGEFVTREEGS